MLIRQQILIAADEESAPPYTFITLKPMDLMKSLGGHSAILLHSRRVSGVVCRAEHLQHEGQGIWGLQGRLVRLWRLSWQGGRPGHAWGTSPACSRPSQELMLFGDSSALQFQIRGAGSNLPNRKRLIKPILSPIHRRQHNYCNYGRYLLQSCRLCREFYPPCMAGGLKKKTQPVELPIYLCHK